ncbi:MAG: ComF family protein [Candidatus Omnitrophota bacterium]
MFGNYLKAAKDLFFPCLCLCCGKKIDQDYLCSQCLGKIVFLTQPRCRYCARAVKSESGDTCSKCRQKVYPYHRLISATAYQEPMASLIHLFKYTNYDYLAGFLASLIKKYLLKISFNPNNHHLITPVPLHRDKLKIRGYNQAGLLAKLLSNYFKIPFRDDIISNTNIRPSQVKLPPQRRKTNVQGIFAVDEDLKQRKIILIDDIFTTGATVSACSKALAEKGTEIITVITLSKTLNTNDHEKRNMD